MLLLAVLLVLLLLLLRTLTSLSPLLSVSGAALAERLWSARNTTQWRRAAPRLAAQMRRLKQRGIPVNVTPWVDSGFS